MAPPLTAAQHRCKTTAGEHAFLPHPGLGGYRARSAQRARERVRHTSVTDPQPRQALHRIPVTRMKRACGLPTSCDPIPPLEDRRVFALGTAVRTAALPLDQACYSSYCNSPIDAPALALAPISVTSLLPEFKHDHHDSGSAG